MGIGGLLLTKYRDFGTIFKILFFIVFLLGLILWVIGNWTKLDTLIMFIIGLLMGLIGGGLIVYYNFEWFQTLMENLTKIIN